jgi:hypothetical protein
MTDHLLGTVDHQSVIVPLQPSGRLRHLAGICTCASASVFGHQCGMFMRSSELLAGSTNHIGRPPDPSPDPNGSMLCVPVSVCTDRRIGET